MTTTSTSKHVRLDTPEGSSDRMTQTPEPIVPDDVVPLPPLLADYLVDEEAEDADGVFQAEIFFTGCTAEQAQEWLETINDLLSHNSEISASISDMSLKEV